MRNCHISLIVSNIHIKSLKSCLNLKDLSHPYIYLEMNATQLAQKNAPQAIGKCMTML